MSYSETLGTIFALLCVWLTVKQNIWCWPTGILNNLFFIVIFTHDRLYADLLLQLFYVVLGFYGWYQWLYGGQDHRPLQVTRTPAFTLALLGVLALLSTFLMASGLREAARLIGAPPPSWLYWDSATAVACLIAQWMLAKKFLESWPIWITTNISYIGLYFTKDRILLCALQVVFIVLSVKGYFSWKKSLAGQQRGLSSASSCPRTEGISS